MPYFIVLYISAYLCHIYPYLIYSRTFSSINHPCFTGRKLVAKLQGPSAELLQSLRSPGLEIAMPFFSSSNLPLGDGFDPTKYQHFVILRVYGRFAMLCHIDIISSKQPKISIFRYLMPASFPRDGSNIFKKEPILVGPVDTLKYPHLRITDLQRILSKY